MAYLTLTVLFLLLVHLLSIFFAPARLLIKEDSLLEYLTAALVILSSLILLRAAKGVKSKNSLLLLVPMALLLLFFGMEEISWGQRILGIQSPEVFITYNYQQETTLHNFFNPILNYAMVAVNLVVAGYFRYQERIAQRLPFLFTKELEALTRPKNREILSFVFLLLAVQCWAMGGELSEEIVAVVVFFGALRLKAYQRLLA